MFVNVMLDVDEPHYIMGRISGDTMRIANDLFWRQDEWQTTFSHLTCNAAKDEDFFLFIQKRNKWKDKEKITDDKTVSIILSV